MSAIKVEKLDKVLKPYSQNPTLVAIFRTEVTLTLLPYSFSGVLFFILYQIQGNSNSSIGNDHSSARQNRQ
jgi:hypothetical protein